MLTSVALLVTAASCVAPAEQSRTEAEGSALPQPTPVPTAVSTTTGVPPDETDETAERTPHIRVAVVSVADGDSFAIEPQIVYGTEVDEVRLVGINAPETHECGAAAARDSLQSLLGSGPVSVTPLTIDRFGRLVGYVTVGPEATDTASPTVDVGLEQVRRGFAIALSDIDLDLDIGPDIDPDPEHDSTASDTTDDRLMVLDDAFTRALKEMQGVWSVDGCMTVESTGLRIAAVRADPPGNDRFELDQEWVEIVNESAVSVELTGFVLRDETTQARFLFPAGSTLGPGATLRVVSGSSDAPRDGVLDWGSRFPIWSNAGDTAFLIDASGRIVDLYRY